VRRKGGEEKKVRRGRGEGGGEKGEKRRKTLTMAEAMQVRSTHGQGALQACPPPNELPKMPFKPNTRV
jgi:hypothetical protein